MLDPNEAVAKMLAMLRRIIGENIKLSWRPGKDIAHLLVDPSQLDQILVNLCVNARDAIAYTGSISIETENLCVNAVNRGEHGEMTPGEYVLLSVGDDGCGMDVETAANIFDPFFTTKGPGLGTGLGLATVYGIVKQNNGFVTVDSIPGSGSTFVVALPAHIPGPQEAPVEATNLPSPGKPGLHREPTVLLVEDDLLFQGVVASMLGKLGYRVVASASPADAVAAARRHSSSFDVLLTDMVLPEMSGLDLANKLLAVDPEVKCLFMSGHASNIAIGAWPGPGAPFIQKPFSMQDLNEKLKAVIAPGSAGKS